MYNTPSTTNPKVIKMKRSKRIFFARPPRRRLAQHLLGSAAVLVAACLLLGGCMDISGLATNASQATPAEAQAENPPAEPHRPSQIKQSGYTLYATDDDYSFSPLEPAEGCYLGAYVLANPALNFDAAAFDEATQKEHALAVYNMRLDEPFPMDWALECLALGKTPYMIVHPPNWHTPFDQQFLAQAVAGFGKLRVPIFVDFYPDPAIYGDAEDYKEFYRATRAEFRRNAPNTVFVSSVDRKNVYDFGLYYPGDDVVDWIGIIIYDHAVRANGDQPAEGDFTPQAVNSRDFAKDLRYFCEEYQRRKPLIISQLAISSFSTIDHKYTSNESANRLSSLYAALDNPFGRIKAVNYMDFNGIALAPSSTVRDNYSVTEEDTMLSAYRSAIQPPFFLSETDGTQTGEKKSIQYPIFSEIYVDGDAVYIPVRALSVYLEEAPDCPRYRIENADYYSVDDLIQSGIGFTIDHKKKTLRMEGLPE